MSRTISRSRKVAAAALSITLAAVASLPAFADGPAPQASAADNGSVWWNELVSSNPEKARDFYASVVGWTPKVVAAEDNSRPPAPGEADYTLFTSKGEEVAGLSKFDGKQPNDPKPGWVTYIQVGDVDRAVEEALKKGGKVLKAANDADGIGRIAVIEDPDGNPVGLYTPVPQESQVAGH
jgi:uncharacterized protein